MVTVTELINSRERTWGDNPTATLVYAVTGTTDDAAAKAALLAYAPLTHDGLIRADGDVDPIFVDTVTNVGQWEGRVLYRAGENIPPEIGDSTYSFSTGGGTQHITQSRGTVRHGAADPAPDFKGAIGVADGTVQGVDITSPIFNWSETHYLDDAVVNATYKAMLFTLTGTINESAFKGFEPLEVLFLGASGSKRGENDWEITLNFAASPNLTGIEIGDIPPFDKKGWSYMWVLYEDVEDDAAKVLVRRPVAVYLETVYKHGDFSALAI